MVGNIGKACISGTGLEHQGLGDPNKKIENKDAIVGGSL